MQLQNNIKLDDLEYITKREKRYNFSRNSLPIVFKRHTQGEGNLSLEDTDEELIPLAMSKGQIPAEKRYFFKNA